jgi:hypothetical protein
LVKELKPGKEGWIRPQWRLLDEIEGDDGGEVVERCCFIA